MLNKQKAIIFLTVLVDAIGIGIILPVLPFYVESFGASAFVITSLMAVFSFCSFFSAPLLGVLSDKYGRRPVLITSILSTSLGWFVFAGTFHIVFLFVGRIIDGLAAGNFSTAQSYLLDVADSKKTKTQNLGLISAAFGLGFILGPMLGGFLSPISPSFPFWFVGFLALVNGALAIFLMPETNKNAQVFNIKKVFTKSDVSSFNPFLPIVRALKNKLLRKPFFIWFLFNLATVAMQSILALYISAAFGFGSMMAGIFMAIIGIVVVLNQAAFLKHFWLRYFSETTLEFWLLLFFGAGFLLMAWPKLIWFVVGLIAMTFANSVLRVVMTSNISEQSNNGQEGELMGVLSSVGAVATILGPLVAGAAFEIKPNIPFFVSALFGFLAFWILISHNQKKLI
ncbi:MAG: MFS transporter [Candidatus Pacebacteria bacterium]|nr:MFS transporter [Candidatus Paceibacterota bacterium]